MLAGRRRRYFGFPRNLDGYIHTPDSAKSYASRLSSAQSFTAALKACNNADILPDPAVSRHYADQHLHSTIATQIPQLLPPMKNTMRFKDFQGNSMKFHPPNLERHFERSLYYIWLSKNDRHELCRIVDSHLGSRGKGTKSHQTSEEYREIGNPIQRPTPAIYASMPRTLSVLDDEITDVKSLKSKFQKGIWDTPKTPRDRFVRDHGQSPAMEAICTSYPGNAMTRVTENDINDCFLAAKRLLGPYSGLNTAVDYSQDEIPEDIIEHIRIKDEMEKLQAEKKMEDGIKKRAFGYNSSRIKYERQIAAALDYYNKL